MIGLFANIACAFVRDKKKRDKLRARLKKGKYGLLMDELAALNCLIKAAAIHKDTFGPYRGIHTGQEAVIVATGPSLSYYEPIPDAIHIGVNSAFKWKKRHLDYLFLYDATWYGMDRAHRDCGFSIAEFNEYGADNNCVKFYGIAQPMMMQRMPTIRVPFADLVASGAKPYIIEDPERHSVAYDLSYEPMGCFSSVAFSALQFALFTNVKRIYIVGADCGGAYFHKSDRGPMLTCNSRTMIEDWVFFKEYIDLWCPEVEIVSVNPRGLRGLFKDIYTTQEVE